MSEKKQNESISDLPDYFLNSSVKSPISENATQYKRLLNRAVEDKESLHSSNRIVDTLIYGMDISK